MKKVDLDKTVLTALDVSKLAKNGPVILTRHGKPLAAVKDLSGSDWESVSLANNPQFLALIEESRRSYRQEGGISLQDIRRELDLKAGPQRRPAQKRKKVNPAS